MPGTDNQPSALTRHFRFFAAMAVGVAATVVAPWLSGTHTSFSDHALLGVVVFFLTYLILATRVAVDLDETGLRHHVEDRDEGIVVIATLAVCAIGVSLWGIVGTLASLKDPDMWALRPYLAMAAVPLGWATIHTLMTFHYAAVYYDRPTFADGSRGKAEGGLDFPAAPADASDDTDDLRQLNIWDFLYYSFTIGMTAQTSDTDATTTRMRRVTLMHAILSFLYNTVIVALAVNAALSFGGS
ncbi:MAG: DUF1345 domain-containing protein [Paracoccus denitrificans]|nr:MAG: DUF1345 domain-containing protein [Paracoccus denitrificans]PZO82681.1 MAG: DUF1345 domain-containing protein [Paracoccus denitrificans]